MVDLTDIGGVAFEQSWPLAKVSVERLLRAHQVPEADRDDIVQEVATRAFLRQEQFTSLTHLTRWSCRVAANLRVDQVRRAKRIADEPVPEWSDTAETARLVEGRVALEKVLSAVSQLSDRDRVALFGDKEETADRREAVKLAVRRHRARARLAAMVEGMIAAFGVLNSAVLRRSEGPGVREAIAISSVTAVALAMPVVAAWRQTPETTPVPQTPVASSPTHVGVSHVVPAAPLASQGDADVSTRVDGPRDAPAAETRPRPVLTLRPDGGGAGAQVETVHPENPKTLCVIDALPTGDACVDRPGPTIPPPPLLPD